MPSITSRGQSILLAAALLSLVQSSAARAELTVDLRLAEPWKFTAGSDKFIFTDPSIVGQKIPIDVYAMVTGADDDATEGMTSMHGAFITAQSVPGSLRGRILPAGDTKEVNFAETIPGVSPWTAFGATRGASKDIPLPGQTSTDAVTDLGDGPSRGGDLGLLVVFRAASLQINGGNMTIIPNGREFRVGRIEFEIQEINGTGNTTLNWYFRRSLRGGPIAEAALFRQDGVLLDGQSGDLSSGQPIVIGAIPEPAALTWVVLCAGLGRRRQRT